MLLGDDSIFKEVVIGIEKVVVIFCVGIQVGSKVVVVVIIKEGFEVVEVAYVGNFVGG